MKIKKKIKYWWDRLTDKKTFRVIYNEGGVTRKVDHFEATNLAAIFKGKVFHDP